MSLLSFLTEPHADVLQGLGAQTWALPSAKLQDSQVRGGYIVIQVPEGSMGHCGTSHTLTPNGWTCHQL